MTQQSGKDERSACQKFSDGFSQFGKFLYNKDTHLVMGRSGRSWAQIGVFYLIFYSFLAGFFAAMLAVFLTTVRDAEVVGKNGGPKLTQFLENQPGLTLVHKIEGAYNSTDSNAAEAYKTKINTYLSGFNTTSHDPSYCTDTVNSGYSTDLPCKYNTSLLGNCSGEADQYFGFTTRQPCIFVKLNKIWNWVPADDGKPFLRLSCDKGTVYPPGGYLKNAFPFRGHKFYQPPPVAVKVPVLDSKIVIQCRLEGKNIEVSDSFNPSRAYGKIEIEVGPAK